MILNKIQFVFFGSIALIFPPLLRAAVNIPLGEEKAIQENFSLIADEPDAVMFTPPQGWLLADPKALPKNVKIMVVGKGSSEYPPSINLATEKFNGSLRQYLKIVKSINQARGDEWKDLGTIRTEAGEASLSQVDTKSRWGSEKLMHVILVRNNTAYILTAAALKEEFPKYYKVFFESMRSLRINKDAFEMVKDSKRKSNLQKAITNVKQAWAVFYQDYKQNESSASKNSAQTAFESNDFQERTWKPFEALLRQEYGDMGVAWQKQLVNKTHSELVD